MPSKFFYGSSLLTGNNTTPGERLTEEEKKYFTETLLAAKEFGLDFYDTIVEKLTYSEMSEVAAYGGFPVRMPHWKYGMEYEELQKGYEYGSMKIYEMVVNCCGFETKVLTDTGSKNAVDVKVGDKVMGTTGWRDVVCVKKQPLGKVYNLQFDGLAQDTICTLNHKWLCYKDGCLVWLRAEDLQVGDAVLAGANYEYYLNNPAKLFWSPDKVIQETRSNVRNRLLPISPPSQMTIPLAELMGVLTGDGSIGVRLASNVITVCIHKPLAEYQQYVVDLFTKVFGREPSIHNKKKSVNVVCLASKFAVDYLDTQGLVKGCIYKNKRVPWSIWASSNEFRAAYLRGLFDTDGSSSKCLSMNCFNDQLAKDVQLLLLEMGIRSKVARIKNKHNDISVVRINGKSNVRKFARHIGFSLGYKQKALEELTRGDGRSGKSYILPGLFDIVYDRVASIEKLPDWMYKYTHKNNYNPNINSLYGFLDKAITEGYEEYFGDLFQIVERPFYVLKSKNIANSQETIDIALDHDAHDFLANGLVTHNTDPCRIYILGSNTLVDNVTVVAHATGHNHFFKNNIYFQHTSRDMMNKLADHGSRVRKYMRRWGRDRVTDFIDHVLRIQTLVDINKAWDQREVKDIVVRDHREYEFPQRFTVDKDRMYMEPWINDAKFRVMENERIDKEETAREIGIFEKPDKDIMRYIRDHAPLKLWQQDIVAMLLEEALYFAPQRQTKVINEGFASYCDYHIMACMGLVGLGQKRHDDGIIHYAIHKAGVLGGKYSMNPYKLGFYLLLDIEDRWNKGKFGKEWDECTDLKKRENWDLNLGLGKQKVFEVCKYYDNVNLIQEFFTQEFCDQYEFFDWQRYPNGEYKIVSRDVKRIKKKLVQMYCNGGLPDIRLVDPNHRGKGWLLLQHMWDGQVLYEPYAREVTTSLWYLWGKEVCLATRDSDGNECVLYCSGINPDKDIIVLSRAEYEKKWQ